MSSYANPDTAYAWLTGDAFRGEPDAEFPVNPFEEPEGGFDGWHAYGGIEVGFELTAEQTVNKKKAFNYRKANYKVLRDPLDEGVKFRALDNSIATALTRAQGGEIVKRGEYYELIKGDGENFKFWFRLYDGIEKTAFLYDSVTLAAPPVRAAIDGQSIDGWEFDLTALAPVREILPDAPTGLVIPPTGG